MNTNTFKGGILFTGHAGVGKTTEITKLLPKLLSKKNIPDHQIIPAISAMHGARKRLSSRLSQIQKELLQGGISFRFSVETIDSLALQIANRCRRLIGFEKPLIPFPAKKICHPKEGTIPLSEICSLATKALSYSSAQRMIQNSFPFVLIDELQDCKDDKLEFIKKLNENIPIIAAADDFQDINIQYHEAPAVIWARSVFRHKDLGRSSYRTRNKRILNTSAALRGIPGTGPPYVNVYDYQAGGMAAKAIMTYLRKYWSGSTAILAFSLKCKFLRDILKSLHKKRKPQDEMQPLIFERLEAEEKQADLIIKEIKDMVDVEYIDVKDSPPSLISKNIDDAWKYCQNMSRRRGLSKFSRTSLIENSLRKLHWNRCYGSGNSKRVVLSVHSAKNQEWDNVFIIWSDRQFPSNTTEEYKMRILYNAVTRAKSNCLILVYDSSGNKGVIKSNSFLKLLYDQKKI